MCLQVHLLHAPLPNTTQAADWVNLPSSGLAVRLYEVRAVMVDAAARLAELSTDWDQTKLSINITQVSDHKHKQIFSCAATMQTVLCVCLSVCTSTSLNRLNLKTNFNLFGQL